MAMNELRKEVEAAAMAELNRENAKFPLFNSTHEGYAVILEEAEEAQEAMENVKTSLAVLWDRVKGIEVACFLDEDTTPTAIFHQAIDAACEMVQTAAMLLKYEMSMGAKRNPVARWGTKTTGLELNTHIITQDIEEIKRFFLYIGRKAAIMAIRIISAAAGAAILILAALGFFAYAVMAKAWNELFD